MPKTNRRLQVEGIAFASGQLRTRELPKTLYKYLMLNVEINHTNAANPDVTIDSFVRGIISKLNIVINGQDVQQSVPLAHLWYMNSYDFSQPPYSYIHNVVGAGTSIVTVIMPFALPRSISPDDTLLDARNVSSIVLECQWGTAADIGTNVTSLDSGSLSIFTSEYQEATNDVSTPIGRYEIGYTDRLLNSIGNIPIDLDYGGNNQYRRIILYTRVSATQALTSAAISNISVRSRSFYWLNMNSNYLQHENKLNYSLAEQTGMYVIDFTTQGRMSERLDARSLSELKLDLTSNAVVNTVRIVKEKVIY